MNLLRIFLIIVFLTGLGLGVAYPWAAANVSGYEIGTWRVYEDGNGFTPAQASIAPSEAPVTITVDMTTRSALHTQGAGDLLHLKATAGDQTVFEQRLDFADAEPRTANPQSGETRYRTVVGKFQTIGQDSYTFEFSAGSLGAKDIKSVDMILNAGAFDLDPRAVPGGYVLIAIGLVGFVGSFLRRKRAKKSDPTPRPRWGRNGEE